MSISTVMVIGSDEMDGGIAQVMAEAGHKTFLFYDRIETAKEVLVFLEGYLNRMVEKGIITQEEKEATIANLIPTCDLKDAAECDLVVESIGEDMKEKERIFRALDEICKPECILASNVSSLPITEIASYTKRPDKVVGMHFFLPVPVMKLVEVGGGLDTSDETINTVVEEARKLGKIPVALKDTPGFISNHVLQVMINEAIDALENDVASVEDIDTVMRLGMNHPMGPLELADLIGLDMVYNILNVLYEAYGQSKYKPCPLLRQYVQAGWLGKKCGRGF